jgi:predicted nucleic acid-binding protein
LRKIVSNATPIISLAVIDRLAFLEDIFKKIYIAEAVYDEITSARYPGYKELDSRLFEVKRINDRESLDSLLNDLDLGEAESIQLASEIKADALIMDERSGYKIAQKKGLPVIGTLTVLLMAKKRGMIKEVKPVLNQMIQKGRWYSKYVYDYFLKSIGEF